jgi:mannosyltransferase
MLCSPGRPGLALTKGWVRIVRDRRSALAVGLLATLASFAWSWHPSLWTDEAATITAARRSLGDLWRMLGTIDAVHGLYYGLAHVWIAVLGSSALSVRLPSALAVGVAAAALLFLVRRLGGSSRAALSCAVVFALLPRTTWKGVEARSYAMATAVAVLLTLIVVIALERPTWRWWIGYALLGGIGIVLNLYLALLLVAHGVSVLLARAGRRAVVGFAGSALVAVLLAAPAVLESRSQSGQLGAQSLGPVRLLRSILVNQAFLGDTATASNTPSTSLSLSGGVGDLWQPAAVLLAVVGLILILTGVLRTRLNGRDDPDHGDRVRLLRWALPWAALPALVVGGYAMLGPPLYSPRYFSFCTPAVAILIGLGLDILRRRWIAAVAVAAMLVLAAPVYISQRQVTAKSGTDWVLVADYVGRHKGPEQGVYFAPRYPTVPGDRVGRTLRSIRVAYPQEFRGLRDVTETTTPAADGTLTGASARLTASGDRLAGLDAVWVIRRNDYPAPNAAQDEGFLQAAGFRPAARWRGPLTYVQEFRRP